MNRNIIKTIPGILLCCLIAWIGFFSSDYIGKDLMGFAKSPISSIMLAIILGLFVGNIIELPSFFSAGIQFSQILLLRLGIIFLGIRLGLGDILRLGAIGLPLIIVCLGSAFLDSTAKCNNG